MMILRRDQQLGWMLMPAQRMYQKLDLARAQQQSGSQSAGALASERAGKKQDALRGYRAAEGYACKPHNPYELDVAKRAAPLALELGAAAEKNGDLRRVFEA
jgi:hypothetical protein